MKKFENKRVLYLFQNNGITLVALVVTIIILFILAGVSLNLISGSNGILEKAKSATEISQLAAKKEQLELDLVAAKADVIINGEKEISHKVLTDIVGKYGELQEDGDTIVTENGNISLKEIYQKLDNNENTDTDINNDETIDDIELSNLVKEMQNLKTELNSLKMTNNSIKTEINILKTSDTGMQTSITELKDSLSPTNYISPKAVNGVSFDGGGYEKIGTHVIVNVGFRVNTSILPLSTSPGGGTATMTVVLEGFPEPISDSGLFLGYTTNNGGAVHMALANSIIGSDRTLLYRFECFRTIS